MQQPIQTQPHQVSAKTHHRQRKKVTKKENPPKVNPPSDTPEQESSDEPATQSTSKTASNPRKKLTCAIITV